MGITVLKSRTCDTCKRAIVCGIGNRKEVICNHGDEDISVMFHAEGRLCAAYCKGYERSENSNNGLIDMSRAYELIRAGNAEFTLYSTKTHEAFSYKVVRKEKRSRASDGIDRVDGQGKVLVEGDKYIYWVSVHDGTGYGYAGTAWFNDRGNEYEFKPGKDSKIEASDVRIRSLLFVLNKLYKGEVPLHCEMYHRARCCACGSGLVGDKDIESGLCKKCRGT